MKWILPLLAFAFVGCAQPEAVDGPAPTRIARGRPNLPGNVEGTLFAPDTVLSLGETLGLSEPLQTAIRNDLTATQQEWDALAERLEVERLALLAILGRARVDEEAADRAARAILRTEATLKSTHLALLIRTKNRLDQAQQETLSRLSPWRQ